MIESSPSAGRALGGLEDQSDRPDRDCWTAEVGVWTPRAALLSSLEGGVACPFVDRSNGA